MALKALAHVPGLVFPRLSEADPDVSAEGSIDPLGLAPLADLLADTIAPGVTARMTRPRLLTAIAVCSVLTESIEEDVGADRVSPPWLVAEWILVEAMVGARLADLRGVPGTTKTRAVLATQSHLDAGSYLKTPKVFGFHGVFKRLAINLDIVDEWFAPSERCYQLVYAWERENGLDGFADGTSGTEGGRLHAQLESAVRRSLDAGVAQPAPNATRLARALEPAAAGREERGLLWAWLADRAEPIRREVVLALDDPTTDALSEAEVVTRLHSSASPDLRMRLDAIVDYERLCLSITRAFDALRILGRQHGTGGVSLDQAAAHADLMDAAKGFARRLARASASLGRLDLDGRVASLLEDLDGGGDPTLFAETLLSHHERIQGAKPPAGKRPWIERTPHGFVVRPVYGIDEQPFPSEGFVHPMRLNALRTFRRDLQS